MTIMVSACLLGQKCKYDGGDNYSEALAPLLKGHRVIPVCPEVAGGLPIPRVPCEISGGRVINADGESRDSLFRDGAEKCLCLAKKNSIDLAVLKSRSPSCGVNEIYDGSFSGRLTQGSGIFASLLLQSGFRVADSDEIHICGLLKNPRIDPSRFSRRYRVRLLNASDIPEIYSLCSPNALFYKYCPPFVTEQGIRDDMKALPPRKDYSDKYYVGYYDGERLVAVMDFIRAYPDERTSFIGFFMTDVSVQRAGVGSSVIDELCGYLREAGISEVRLGWVRGNPQSEAFWHKNGFRETGVTYDTDGYTVIVAARKLVPTE